MTQSYQMRIGGRWCDSASGRCLPTVNPYDQSVWATIPQADETDVEAAVAAAATAFDTGWGHGSVTERARLMFRLADLVEQNADHLATVETRDNGKLFAESRANMLGAARAYRFFAGIADKTLGEVVPMPEPHLFDYTLRQPYGVVAIVTPWNAPVFILSSSLAPALATGNCVVIKPSEFAAVSTLEFCRLVEAAGFPPGVVNVVTGDSAPGDALTRHPLVAKISFTGGPAGGRAVAANAARNLRPLVLELGGKSPNILFADADLDRAVPVAARGIFGSGGQVCAAGSRILVQRPVYEQVLGRLAEFARGLRLGDPMAVDSQMGPLANRPHYGRVLSMIDAAAEEGAVLCAGGGKAEGPALAGGLFVQPTVLGDVTPGMSVAQHEVFGPVVCVMPFDDEEEAVAIANGTDYGLASGIWTRDLGRAHRMARRIQAGQVWINTYRDSGPQIPFGGVKGSGYGRVRGVQALMEFTTLKNVMIDIS